MRMGKYVEARRGSHNIAHRASVIHEDKGTHHPALAEWQNSFYKHFGAYRGGARLDDKVKHRWMRWLLQYTLLFVNPACRIGQKSITKSKKYIDRMRLYLFQSRFYQTDTKQILNGVERGSRKVCGPFRYLFKILFLRACCCFYKKEF